MTNKTGSFNIFASEENFDSVNNIAIIAFTHKNTELKEIGKLHIEESQLKERLHHLKTISGADELTYLSTCNRVEFLLSCSQNITGNFLHRFFKAFNPEWNEQEIEWAVSSAIIFKGKEAIEHLFRVASSIDSLVVGEREIITQVRNAYELCNKIGITGDMTRLLLKKTIETAKQVYTHTHIARKPVSVVSLAYRKLKELHIKPDAKFLIIGSGVTNTTMTKYLDKHGFKNFTFFNRTFTKALKLAEELNGTAYPLSELKNYKAGFDVIITCTGSTDFVVTQEIYSSLLKDDKTKKIVVDLAVPNDFDPEILNNYNVNLISISNLQSIAKENLQERQKELDACHAIIDRNMEEFQQILKTRKVELSMSEVPKKIKEIREMAINNIFAKDIEQLDKQSKEVLDKVLAYMEKKYISVPMKMAKAILAEDVEGKG